MFLNKKKFCSTESIVQYMYCTVLYSMTFCSVQFTRMYFSFLWTKIKLNGCTLKVEKCKSGSVFPDGAVIHI